MIVLHGMVSGFALVLLVTSLIYWSPIGVAVALVLALALIAIPGYQWALKGTIPAGELQSRVDRWYMERYGENLPPASWEDPSHPAYNLLERELAHTPNPNIAIVKRRRDDLLAKHEWDRAVAATDQIIRLIEDDANGVKAPLPSMTAGPATVRERAARKSRDHVAQLSRRLDDLHERIEQAERDGDSKALLNLLDVYADLMSRLAEARKNCDYHERTANAAKPLVLGEGVKYASLKGYNDPPLRKEARVVSDGVEYTAWKSR